MTEMNLTHSTDTAGRDLIDKLVFVLIVVILDKGHCECALLSGGPLTCQHVVFVKRALDCNYASKPVKKAMF